MKGIAMMLIGTLAAAGAAAPREYHVSPAGGDANDGSPGAMLRSISAAAARAEAGDTITVHAGLYRERIDPPRGGASDEARIVYRAAPGEAVEIRGSEPVTGWSRAEGDAWTATLPKAFFGDFNPFADRIRGDWFDPKGRDHHTGAVYLDGHWLAEAAALDDVLKPAGDVGLWYARVGDAETTVWAQFKGTDPNARLVEVNVRKAVFYPSQPGIDYLTVRGFTMRHAATNWAPPTAEQAGLIGTHWSKGWTIEDCTVTHSACSGIALGKHGDEFDNTSADTAEGYVETIHRALARGWSRERIGSHAVRNCTIAHCEQAGIVGSMGAAFSTIEGNTIHDVHVRRAFSGAEMAGIKFHGAIDAVIRGNRIFRCVQGLWLDWMAQGARVSGNLFHDNLDRDLFMEVNHGPYVIDNNLFLSPNALLNVSRGGLYVHNLMAGAIHAVPYDARQTPYHAPHSTQLAGMHDNPDGDDRWYNNLLVKRPNLGGYDEARLPVRMEGNVFLDGARPSKHEADPLAARRFDPGLALIEEGGSLVLELSTEMSWAADRTRPLVRTEMLGNAAVPNLPFENRDGSPLRIDTDYFGRPRGEANPAPGPFATPGAGPRRIPVWPPAP